MMCDRKQMFDWEKANVIGYELEGAVKILGQDVAEDQSYFMI